MLWIMLFFYVEDISSKIADNMLSFSDRILYSRVTIVLPPLWFSERAEARISAVELYHDACFIQPGN